MIEQIKHDRFYGTPGPWAEDPLGVEAVGDISTTSGAQCVAQAQQVAGDDRKQTVRCANTRRIARVPELEEYILEAHELLKEVLAGACVNYAYIAPRHIERIKKLVGEA